MMKTVRALKLIADGNAETLGGPSGFAGFAEAGFFPAAKRAAPRLSAILGGFMSERLEEAGAFGRAEEATGAQELSSRKRCE